MFDVCSCFFHKHKINRDDPEYYACNLTQWQHSEECMCCLQNIAMRDYQESMTTGQTDTGTDRQTDDGQSNLYVPLCFAGDTKILKKIDNSWEHDF